MIRVNNTSILHSLPSNLVNYLKSISMCTVGITNYLGHYLITVQRLSSPSSRITGLFPVSQVLLVQANPLFLCPSLVFKASAAKALPAEFLSPDDVVTGFRRRSVVMIRPHFIATHANGYIHARHKT